MNPIDDEMVSRNLDALKDFLLTQFNQPTLVDQIPNGAHIFILPHNDPDLLATNLKLAANLIERMAIGQEPQAPVILLSTTKTGEFIVSPIYDALNVVG